MTHLREAVGLLNSLPLAGLMLVITAGFLPWHSRSPAGGSSRWVTRYAATYVVASVLVALAGQLVVHLVS